MDFYEAAISYYSKWLDVNLKKLEESGVTAICSKKRDELQPGYNRKFGIYCFIKGGDVVISYSKRFEDNISTFVQTIKNWNDEGDIKDALAGVFGSQPVHTYKYFFTSLPENMDTSKAVRLTCDDYSDFLQFFRRHHPNIGTEDWLKDYYVSIANKNYVYGVYDDNHLVSVTDAPDIPYMSDLIVEPGINTLEKYRQRGYAKIAVGAFIKNLLKSGRVPIWSCGASNTASQKLAESLGYKKLADVISIASR